MKIDGGCHCGAITFEADVDPDKVVICHCTDCQTLSGSAFRTVALTYEDAFTLRSGEPKIYVKTAQSGAKRQQSFCPECGTPISQHPTRRVPKSMACASAPFVNAMNSSRNFRSGRARNSIGWMV